ncbi:MAG: prolipoprotein diacylglyceryl transferase [Planctomycetota bacterium]|nr:prolipoprotein diacylglyceryl transferase [Planctomycetota bacterium]
MTFPVYITIGEWRVHSHPVFETLAYLIGFQVYLLLRRRGGDPIDRRTRRFVILAAICGAALGSKILFWLIDPALSIEQWRNPGYVMGGKTIVGALVGGVMTVEIVKRMMGVRVRTGDLFALPLCLGIAVGRIGCFLAGLEDHTHGVATGLPWAVDFGDGIPRHPTQLYEIAAALLIGLWVIRRGRSPHARGDLFLGFLLLYLFWRLLVEFIKPGLAFAGLTSIQWVCLLTLLAYARRIPGVFGRSQGA